MESTPPLRNSTNFTWPPNGCELKIYWGRYLSRSGCLQFRDAARSHVSLAEVRSRHGKPKRDAVTCAGWGWSMLSFRGRRREPRTGRRRVSGSPSVDRRGGRSETSARTAPHRPLPPEERLGPRRRGRVRHVRRGSDGPDEGPGEARPGVLPLDPIHESSDDRQGAGQSRAGRTGSAAGSCSRAPGGA